MIVSGGELRGESSRPVATNFVCRIPRLTSIGQGLDESRKSADAGTKS